MRQIAADYLELTKPRVQSLLLWTTVTTMLVAGSPSVELIFFTCLGGALSTGSAGAINHFIDRDIDLQMERTANRPIPAGRITPRAALTYGIFLGVASVVVLVLAVNTLAAVLATAGLLGYVFVYTLWLKRRTPQNIVIGGAAGAVPPLVGWAAVTGSLSPTAWLLFAIVFMWTPPHFWALALFMKEDYHKAGVPMLTVTHGRKATRSHILVYTILLAPVALAAAFTSIGGPVYLAISVALNAGFLWGAWRIWQRDEAAAESDNYRVEKAFFRFSLYYLFLHFGAFLLQVALKSHGLGGW